MDEHFTLHSAPEMEGGGLPSWGKTYTPEQASTLYYAGILTASSAVTNLCKVLFVCAIIWIIITIARAIPDFYVGYSKLVNKKWQFTNKEGLQYIGAKANQLRDDVPYAQDSLAEQAAAAQERVTNMAAAKAAFSSREGLASKPEEDLKKSFAQ